MYSLFYQGSDLAGNVTSCTVVTAFVPPNQGKDKGKDRDRDQGRKK